MIRFWTLIAIMLTALLASPMASAQSVANKVLCEGSASGSSCDQVSSPPQIGEPVYYQFQLYGGPTASTLSLAENYPASFSPADATNPISCTVSNGSGTGNGVPVTIISLGAPLQFSVDLDGGQDAICRMEGTFTNPGGTAVNSVQMQGSGTSANHSTVISANTELDLDLEIKKELLLPTAKPLNISGGAQRAKYRLTVKTDEAIYLGDFFRVYDQLALFPNGMSVTATLLPGSICKLASSGAIANCGLTSSFSGDIVSPSWRDFAAWGITDGGLVLLQPSDELVIEYEVEYSVPADVSCIKEADSEGIRNRAFLGLTGSKQALRDDDDDNNDTVDDDDSDLPLITGIYNVAPNCSGGGGAAAPPSPLTITKQMILPDPPTKAWGSSLPYAITLKNTSTTQSVYDIDLSDYIQNLQGVPNYQAQLVGVNISCPSGNCTQLTPTPPTPPAGPVKSISSYYDRKEMWSGTILQLAPGQQFSLLLHIKFEYPTCDFAPLVENKLIRNRASASHKVDMPVLENGVTVTKTFSYVKHAEADIRMQTPPACQIKVEKKSKPTKQGNYAFPVDRIIFDKWKPYEIVFSALPTAPNTLKIGTLIDAVRLQNPFYATGLSLEYQWQCNDLSNGGVRGFENSGNGTATVNHVGAPHQGVRIMSHPDVVEFDPGASLKCDVKIKVQKPSENDPYCQSEGQPLFQNLALMDGSRYFNSSMPWPHAPKGLSWDSSSDKLPKCYNLVVNKTASPGIVSRNGGPITYRVQVTNANLPGTDGDIDLPVSAAGNSAPYFTDLFLSQQSNGTVVPSNPRVHVASNPCAIPNAQPCHILPSVMSGASRYDITQLPAQQSLTIEYTVDGPFGPHQICNRVRGHEQSQGQRWYEGFKKHPPTWTQTVCVPVRAKLEVEKQFITPPWVTIAPSTAFNIEVDCNAPSGFDDFSRDLFVSPANPKALMDRIVIGSTCKIDEVDLPDPDQWGDCEWEDPVYPGGKSVSADGHTEPHKLLVVNQLKCKAPPTILDIKKELMSAADCPSSSAICTFRITVTNIGQNPYAGDVDISDVFTNASNPTIYSLISTNPFTWDWTCQQSSANDPIECEENYLQLAAGGSAYFDITLDMPNGGTNCAELETPDQSPKPESCVSVAEVSSPQLVIIKNQLTPTDCYNLVPTHCEFEITVKNIGSSDYTGPISVTDRLSPALPINLVANSAGWNCSSASTLLTCSNSNLVIAAGASKKLRITLDLSHPVRADRNCAALVAPQITPQPLSCVNLLKAVDPIDPRNLDIVKEKITPGSCHGSGNNANHCTFRITITNSGSSNVSGPLQFTDTISGGGSNTGNVSVVSVSPAGWNCTASALTTTCSNGNIAIAAGQSVTIDLTLDLNFALPAEKNCASVGKVDGFGRLIKSCVNIFDAGTPELSLKKIKVTNTPCQLGVQTCHFRFEITNTGSSPYNQALSFEDQFYAFSGFSNLSVQSVTGGWSHTTFGGSVYRFTNSSFQLAAGATSYVDVIFNYGGQFSARRNCARLVGTNGIGPDSCVEPSQISIKKELISNPNCSVTGNRQCSFRITLTENGMYRHTGPLSVDDVYSFVNTAMPSPIISAGGNGWTCQPRNSNIGMDCSHPGPAFQNTNVTSFQITIDASLGQQTHMQNCATLSAMSFQPARKSCVPVGPLGWQGLRRKLNKDLKKKIKKTEKAMKKVRKKKKKFKLPKIRVEIGIGGIFGGKRKKGQKPKPDRDVERDAAGNPIK